MPEIIKFLSEFLFSIFTENISAIESHLLRYLGTLKSIPFRMKK